jgi:hypothetical protein
VDRIVLIVGAVSIAGAVAFLVNRRRPDRPTAPTAHVPRQLDRADFVRPDASWLVALFSSESCSTCAGVWERARHMDSPQVAVQQLEASRDADVHARYEIDTVPTLLIVDRAGVVRRWFLGPVNSTDLWAGVAEAREPGSVPPGCATGDS